MQIYIMNSDGENIQQLPRYSFSNLNPQFTPDGDRVIYIADGLLYSRKIDGTDITYHQAQLGSEYSVHPFENKVLFSEIKNDSGYIFELDINTSAIINIITRDYYIIDPVYFPNGSKIAYASNDDWRCNIFSINPDGSDKVQLTNLPHPNKVLTPVWSPDNFHILFQYWDGVDNGAVYQINNDGTSLIELTNYGRSQAWSPDMTRISYSVDTDSSQVVDSIFIYDVVTGEKMKLTDGIHAKWSQNKL